MSPKIISELTTKFWFLLEVGKSSWKVEIIFAASNSSWGSLWPWHILGFLQKLKTWWDSYRFGLSSGNVVTIFTAELARIHVMWLLLSSKEWKTPNGRGTGMAKSLLKPNPGHLEMAFTSLGINFRCVAKGWGTNLPKLDSKFVLKPPLLHPLQPSPPTLMHWSCPFVGPIQWPRVQLPNIGRVLENRASVVAKTKNVKVWWTYPSLHFGWQWYDVEKCQAKSEKRFQNMVSGVFFFERFDKHIWFKIACMCFDGTA